MQSAPTPPPTLMERKSESVSRMKSTSDTVAAGVSVNCREE